MFLLILDSASTCRSVEANSRAVVSRSERKRRHSTASAAADFDSDSDTSHIRMIHDIDN